MKTITNLKDFCPKTTIVIDGCADFKDYPEITDLGNLQEIKGYADFENSQVQSLGILQTIGRDAYFCESQVQSLGNLQTIGGTAYFQNSQIQSLGNLQKIGGSANFQNSQVQNLGNLQTIEGDAFFRNSKVQDLGNLQTIGVNAYFGNRTDLESEWEAKNKKNQTKNKMKTITDLKDFCPKTTIVFDGNAEFEDFPEITHLGNLKRITGVADFISSQVQDLGKLQIIGDDALFGFCQIKDLGNLQTIGGTAYFQNSQIQSLGNLQKIGGSANFQNSQVQNLGNLQTIQGDAFFRNSKVQDLGNLQTIGVNAYFGNRTDLEAEWEKRISEKSSSLNLCMVNGVNDLKVQLSNRSRGETFNDSMSFRMSQKHRQKLSALSVKYDADMGSVIRALISLFNDDEFDADVRGVVVSNSGTIEHPLNLKMDMLDNKVESLLSSVGDLVAERVTEKTFQNTDSDGAKKNVSDIQFWGDGDTFKLISKAWSKKEGWMKSTKAMEIKGVGCVIQVTTQEGSNVAEAVTFAPNCRIKEETDAAGNVIKRTIIGNLVA